MLNQYFNDPTNKLILGYEMFSSLIKFSSSKEVTLFKIQQINLVQINIEKLL